MLLGQVIRERHDLSTTKEEVPIALTTVSAEVIFIEVDGWPLADEWLLSGIGSFHPSVVLGSIPARPSPRQNPGARRYRHLQKTAAERADAAPPAARLMHGVAVEPVVDQIVLAGRRVRLGAGSGGRSARQLIDILQDGGAKCAPPRHRLGSCATRPKEMAH